MKSINLYIFILIAPALLLSLRIILVEVAALVSISNYAKELFWIKSLIGKVTGSEIKQSEINEELVSILQMISIMISLCLISLPVIFPIKLFSQNSSLA